MATTSLSETPVIPLEKVEADTLTKTFLASVKRNRAATAMLRRVGEGEWQPILFSEVERRVAHLAAGLRSVGIQRGDRVAILSENRPEWAIADYACLFLGATVVPVYTTLPPAQISYILRDAGVRLLFVSTAELLGKVLEVRGQLPQLESFVVFDPIPKDTDVRQLSEIEEAGATAAREPLTSYLEELAGEVDPEDLATLIYTSGTTGDPKGVMLTHWNIASNIAASRQHNVIDLDPGNVALSFLPLSHAFERLLDYYYFHAGATIAYVPAVDLVAQSLMEVRPHIAGAAPRIFEKIYARVMAATGLRGALIAWAKKVGEATVDERLAGRTGPAGLRERIADRLVFSKLRARTGGRIRAFISGSAPLSAEIAKFFWAAGIPVFEGYGLTETSPVLTVNRPGQVKLGSIGIPLPGTEIRIAPNGEILARGPQIMKGYYQRPEATAEVIDADGWLHTGDIGMIDADGFVWITDRLKNIIVTAGGKNIAPAPIENEVALSPFVSQVVMIGDRRPFPSLLIVPDFDYVRGWAKDRGITDAHPEALVRDSRLHEAIEKEVFSRLSGFARYELPKKVALIASEFTIDKGELTPSLKVKRHVVERNYASTIEELYAEARSGGRSE